ncbi:MAG: aldo/keto reductase [Candidatus Omnitrophica bacterium]|nr:aldo/keto reductase [Candidatus Omnitrophota bacterium]
METRALGKTGIKVSEISLGGVAFTWLGRKRAEKLIDFCIEKGINYIDVYSGTGEKIRDALKRHRNNLFISTRGNSKTLENCLKEFGLDYFDIFLLSMIDSKDQLKQAIDEASNLEKFRRQGKFKILGIATHNPAIYEPIIESKIFEVMMVPVNCIDEVDNKVYQEARKKGIGIIAMKPLAGGNLQKYDSAIKYVLNLPISTAIIGMARIKEVQQNIRVLKNLEITPEDDNFYREIRKKLGKVFCRYCGHCIFPQPCPEDIPVRTIMMLETLAYQANLRRNVSEKTLKSIERCRKCGLCEERCPYQLPIRKLLPEKVKWYLKMTC